PKALPRPQTDRQPSIARALCGSHILARTAPGPLACDNHTAFEDLTTPNTPRLFTFQGRVEALTPNRAVGAQLLGALQLRRVLGEPQIGVTDMTRQLGERPLLGSFPACRERHVRFTCFLVEIRRLSSGGSVTRCLGPKQKATDPW